MIPRLIVVSILLLTLLGRPFGRAQEVFVGAPAPAPPPKESPAGPGEQLKTFSLPPGFEIELVAADPDIANVITVAFDDSGKMWAITATEYPVDANEQPDRARRLYEQGGRDRVLVFDTPAAPGRQRPRTFAEGLAIPLGVLPLSNGVLVGHGSEILLLRDSDGDGKADEREVILSGFGIQDSHLMPHQFTRGPGGWVYLAQGAFNSSKVKGRDGRVVEFNQCKMGRFKPDGTRFEIVCWGLNNIWGFVIDRHGEMFIQEANDLGYPVVPLFIGASYPGIGMHKAKPYSPWQPPLAKSGMGGTGLSGLALAEDRNGFPPPYGQVMYVANPITRQVQAIRIQPEGAHHRLEKLPDFINCSDPWFRPVAIHFGPDSSLYIVDWYNKIISHNEIPRDHPDRDKSHGRIWRVRHESMKARPIPDLTRPAPDELIHHLNADCAWEARAARHQIIDRDLRGLVPNLLELVEATGTPPELLLNALWALEGLGEVELATFRKLARHGERSVRREAVRVLASAAFTEAEKQQLLEPLLTDPDPQVRAEIIRTLDAMAPDQKTIELLVRMGKEPMEGTIVRPQQGGQPALTGDAADRAFERSLVRAAIEEHAEALAAFLEAKEAETLPIENRILATLALPAEKAAERLAEWALHLRRPLDEEETALLAQFSGKPRVGEVLTALLEKPDRQRGLIEDLLKLRPRLDPEKLAPLIAPVAKKLAEAGKEGDDLWLDLAGSFRISDLEPEVVAYVSRIETPEGKLKGVQALREMKASQPGLFQTLALSSKAGDALQRQAVLALAETGDRDSVNRLIEVWPVLPAPLRKAAVNQLSSSKQNSAALLQAIERGDIPADLLDEFTVEKLKTVLGGHPLLARLEEQFVSRRQPVLRLNGHPDDYLETGIDLVGPFTVETWIKLDPGISNADGILARPNGADFNFADARFRVFAGRQHGDVIIAKSRTEPEVWTHVAVTRDAENRFRIYIDGRLDTDESRAVADAFTGLDAGRTIPNAGTAGWLTEFRVWEKARSASEIQQTWKVRFDGETPPPGLKHYFAGKQWPTRHGKAEVVETSSLPPMQSWKEAAAFASKLDAYRALAGRPGDAGRGKELFQNACAVCHNVSGEGGQIGPTLNGAGLLTTEALLHSLLEPNEAVEPGYYQFRVETMDGDVWDGFLVTQDGDSVVLRRPNSQDQRIPRRTVKRGFFTRTSMMPEGLLESLNEGQVADLFAYLRTLK